MKRKGVLYDVGRVMGVHWRPHFDPIVVHRELELIKNDLHCNAVRICGQDIARLVTAASDALSQGLDVWLLPELWDRSQEQTLAYLVKAARAAETLREQWSDQLVLSVGSELTLFMRGILEGKTLEQRMNHPAFWATVKAGKHNQPLREFLARANDSVRQVYHGQVAYGSLIWEQVEWKLFDYVSVDHYWDERIKDRYVDMLQPSFSFGKPVVITEFGFPSCRGGEPANGAMSLGGNADPKTLFLHQLPMVGRLIRPRVKHIYERDESLQASKLLNQLNLLEQAGVEGGFIFTFAFPIFPYDVHPRYDLDRASASLVKTFAGNQHGTTYPDMPWEPKEAFKVVADYYAAH